MPTRRSLLSRIKDWNDHDSWRDFFDTYWKLIYSTALRSGLSDAEAQEVVQETVLSVAKHIPEFSYDPRKGSFKNWMLTMTKWRIKDQVKKRHSQNLVRAVNDRDGTGTGTIERIADPNALDPGEHWDLLWEENLLDTAIQKVRSRIDPKHFQVFDLCAVRKLKPKQVAATLNLNLPSIYLIKHRVSKLVKKEFDRLMHSNPMPQPVRDGV